MTTELPELPEAFAYGPPIDVPGAICERQRPRYFSVNQMRDYATAHAANLQAQLKASKDDMDALLERMSLDKYTASNEFNKVFNKVRIKVGTGPAAFEVWLEARRDFVSGLVERANQADSLQAQVAELQALSVTRILIDVVPGDGSGQEVYAKSVFDVVNKLSELADLADSLQAQVDALAGALLEQKRADAYTVAYRHLPEAAEQIAEAQEGAIRMREAALAAAGR